MTFARTGLLAPALAVALGAGACGGDSSTGSQGVFQLASVTTNSLIVQCGTNPFGVTFASPESLLVIVHMVNTTGSDVSVTSVGSVGTVIHASNDAVLGQMATTFTSLNYEPQPTLVRARDGDVTITVRIPMVSTCVQTTTPRLEYKDTSTSLRVYTSAGLYVTAPMTLHLNFVGGS